jgi:hypothetical protein
MTGRFATGAILQSAELAIILILRSWPQTRGG